MNNSMYTATFGLNNFQKAIDVESHNVANVNTVAYKENEVSFSDVMYQQNLGYGGYMNETQKLYDQGGIKATGIDYDFAINGGGFFTLSSESKPDEPYYTRAGNFNRGIDGHLGTTDGFSVMGVAPVVTGEAITSEYDEFVAHSTVDDGTTVTALNTYVSEYKSTAIDTGASGSNFKTSSSNNQDIEALKLAYRTALIAYTNDPSTSETAVKQKSVIELGTTMSDGKFDIKVNIDGYSYVQPFDTSVENTLNLFSDQLSAISGITTSVDTTTGTLTLDSVVSGKKFTIISSEVNEIVVSNETTTLATGAGKPLVDTVYAELKSLVEAMGGQIATSRTEVTKATTMTTPTLSKINLNMESLGVHEDKYEKIEFEDGNIFLVNGDAKFLVGQLVPVIFNNNQSLNPEGDNMYTTTSESGVPIYVEGASEIRNNMLELSTSDLGVTLVNLMAFQKAFEANSKAIVTSDEFLQTAINLKK